MRPCGAGAQNHQLKELALAQLSPDPKCAVKTFDQLAPEYSTPPLFELQSTRRRWT